MEQTITKKSFTYMLFSIVPTAAYILFMPINSLTISISAENWIFFLNAFLTSVIVFSAAKLLELALYRENGFRIEADFSYFSLLYFISCILFAGALALCSILNISSILIVTAILLLLYAAIYFITPLIENHSKKITVKITVPMRIISICPLVFSVLTAILLTNMLSSEEMLDNIFSVLLSSSFFLVSIFTIIVNFAVFGATVIIKRIKIKRAQAALKKKK